MAEYYSDELVTPHPLRPTAQDAEPQVLSAVIRHQEFGEQLAALDGGTDYEENALAAAHIIGSQVREALWYPETADDYHRLGLDRREPLTLGVLPEK